MAAFTLEIVEGPGSGSAFPVSGEVEIGRGDAAGLTLKDGEVSRRHARVAVTGGSLTVEDLGSRNGSYVNDQPLQGARELRDGDRLRVGLTVLEVHAAADVTRAASRVISTPPITQLGQEVLAPVAERELPAAVPEPQVPGFLAPETEPAYVPKEGAVAVAPVAAGAITPGQGDEGGEQYQRVAALRDPRVRQSTRTAALAMMAVVALLLIVYFGALR